MYLGDDMFFVDINGEKINDIRKMFVKSGDSDNLITMFVMINSNIFLAMNNGEYFDIKIENKIYYCKLNYFSMKISRKTAIKHNENRLLEVVLKIEEERDA